MPPDTLVIMLKVPRPGRVKTRLAAGLGVIPATWWFRHQTSRLLRNLAYDCRWQTVLAVSPDFEGLNSRVWPINIARSRQGGGDLGKRMRRQFSRFAPGRVIVIGADIPDIRSHHISSAFKCLAANEAVIGPAPDGGYWLLGLSLKSPVLPNKLLENVRWSTEFARRDTLKSLGTLRVATLETLQDVDTVQDLKDAN